MTGWKGRWPEHDLVFDYPTELHHSQTFSNFGFVIVLFDYPTELHHSQTHTHTIAATKLFDYPTELHHSQTVDDEF